MFALYKATEKRFGVMRVFVQVASVKPTWLGRRLRKKPYWAVWSTGAKAPKFLFKDGDGAKVSGEIKGGDYGYYTSAIVRDGKLDLIIREERLTNELTINTELQSVSKY